MTNYKILIADDEQEIVELLQTRLEVAGYKTVVAYEGIRAVEMAHKQKPDLILLDLKMPVGKGDLVLETLRGRADTEKIPVIVVTALPASDVREKVLALGAQDFIQKPYDAEVLLAKIRALLA